MENKIHVPNHQPDIYIYIVSIWHIRRPRPTQGGARKGREVLVLVLVPSTSTTTSTSTSTSTTTTTTTTTTTSTSTTTTTTTTTTTYKP